MIKEMIPLHRTDGEGQYDATTVTSEEPIVEKLSNGAWESGERYFVWVENWVGRYLQPQICLERYLPKSGVVRKVKLTEDDRRSLRELCEAYPIATDAQLGVLILHTPIKTSDIVTGMQ